MKWLQNNPVAKGLLYFCGGLLLIAGVLSFMWARPISTPEVSVEEGVELADVSETARGTPLGELEEYAVVGERPIFNEDRRPVVIIDTSVGVEEPAVIEEFPETQLMGVIITPDTRLATLRDKSSSESMLAHEGEPMEGVFAGWHIASIEPRKVVVRSEDGREVPIELSVHDQQIKPPPKPATPAANNQVSQVADAAEGQNNEEPLSRAEEIRQRIAERREQLRQEAEANQTSTEDQPPSYEEAINSLVEVKEENSDNDDT